MSHHGYGQQRYGNTNDEDFSESEYVSDSQMVVRPAADLTELYRRKHQIQARNYYSLHHHHNNGQGYYEPQVLSRLPPHLVHPSSQMTCPCNPPLPPVDPRRFYWYGDHLNDPHEGMVYNSTPIIQSPGKSRRESANYTNNNKATVKKYPVTVRTPRYCNRGAPALYKRPSTLCLPVTCQPDPAATVTPCRRPRKSAAAAASSYRCYHDHPHRQDPEVATYRTGEKKSVEADRKMNAASAAAAAVPRLVDSEGDVNSRLNDLENLLTKFNDDADDDGELKNNDGDTYEAPGGNDDDDVEDGGKVQEICSDKLLGMSSLSDVAKILKPKVPASIKAKQEKIAKMQAAVSQHNSGAQNSARTHNSSKPNSSCGPISKKEDSLDVLIRHLSSENLNVNNTKSPRDECKDYYPSDSNQVRSSMMNKNYFDGSKPPLDDNSALELHRSKSYIVSLIDKALSKELGTVPGDKCSRKDFANMNPKRAVDLVNRHTFHKSEVPLSNQEHQSAMATTSTMIRKKESECICDTSYLKHLRNMRWTHLRQIQREARRLTDLERLLDSLSDGDQ